MSASTLEPFRPTHRELPHERGHKPRRPRHRAFYALVGFCRTIHIYLTMLGLFVMLLFGVTGFTINHEEWFGATNPRVEEYTAAVPPALMAAKDRLGLVERLRADAGVGGAVTSFDDLDEEISIGFKEPGQIWEVRIAKADGKVQVHHEIFNFAALINNLHRGRYAGESWRWVIDASAGLIVLACATGFVLWLALPRRRQLGVALLVLGTVGTVAVILLLVPGAGLAI